jgi:DNA adenine methylase
VVASDLRPKFPQPFLKWAGGKSQLLPQISKLFPKSFRSYFEPFLGGGAVFFYLRPHKATISDSNIELYKAYSVIRDDLDSLLSSLEHYQRQKISRRLYERIRKLDPEGLPDDERVARFIFLNKTCYNGLYRVNKKGRFNVPFGKYSKMPTLFDMDNLLEISRLLQSTKIMFASYETPLERAEPDDFVYLDPPYSVDPEAVGFTTYTKEDFSASDQRRLASKFKELDRRGCKLLLSNSDNRTVRELYANYSATTMQIQAGRMISCVGSQRTGFKELLIMNYEPPSETLAPWLKQTN